MNRVFARLALVTWLGVGVLLFAVPPAQAYIDPGAGSLIVQTLVAGAMAGGLIIKTQWRRLRRLITRRGNEGRGDGR